MPELKVYGWTGYRQVTPHRHPQTREICAAPSMAAVARAAGMTRPRQLWNLCETANDAEVAKAMSAPGVVFWRPLDDYGGAWWRAVPENRHA